MVIEFNPTLRVSTVRKTDGKLAIIFQGEKPMSKTFSGVSGDSKCECADALCPVHTGESSCGFKATTILYRVDMEDQTGTAMCEACADDAFEIGLFTDCITDEDGLEPEYEEETDIDGCEPETK